MASMASVNVIPETSKEKYMNAYSSFNNWRNEQGTNLLSENVFLAYFGMLSSKRKPSSLWAQYSMLRMTVNINDKTDISKYAKLKAFLKRKSDGYRPRKSKIFTPEEINKFINEAPDSQYLLTKVVLIMGVMGACRRDELHKMKLTDIKDLGSAVLVEIPNTKTKIARKFVITGRFYDIFKQYAALRPQKASPSCFFLNYQKGKCTVQKIGINKIGQVGKQIAKYLNLANPELYTGHCFRRSSATILVNSGGDIMPVKRCGGWKSTIVAEEYIGTTTDVCSSNMLDTSDDSTFAKQCTEMYVKPDYIDPLQFKIENQTEFLDNEQENEHDMIISPGAIKKEKDLNSFEFVDTNSNDDINMDCRTNFRINENNNGQRNPETIILNQNEIWKQSDVDYSSLETELKTKYEGRDPNINGNVTPEICHNDTEHKRRESNSSSQTSTEDSTEYDEAEFNLDKLPSKLPSSSDRTEMRHNTRENGEFSTKSLSFEENDKEANNSNYCLNADTENDCHSKVNISTQTEENVHTSHGAEMFIDNFLADVYKEIPKTWSEAVNRMFEIDRCIKKLTKYRQSLFRNTIPLDECYSSLGSAKHMNTNQNPHKNNAQGLAVLSKKRKESESEEVLKIKKFIATNPLRDDLEVTESIINNSNCDTPVISEKSCTETVQFSKESNIPDNGKNCCQFFPVPDERILVIKVMENKLVTGTLSGKIIFFNLQNNHSKTVLDVNSMPITSVVFIKRDVILMCVGSLNKVLKIYNFCDRSVVQDVALEESIQCMEHNWGYIFMGCTEGSLLRYSIEKKNVESREKFSDNSILVVRTTEEGTRRLLLIGSYNEPVCIRDAMTGLYLRTMENIISPTMDSLVLEKNLVYWGSNSENIFVYSIHDGKLIQGHKVKDSRGIKCIKMFSNLLFASCYNGKIYVYDVKNNIFISEIYGPEEVILAMEIVENQVIASTVSLKLISLPIPEYILRHKL